MESVSLHLHIQQNPLFFNTSYKYFIKKILIGKQIKIIQKINPSGFIFKI